MDESIIETDSQRASRRLGEGWSGGGIGQKKKGVGRKRTHGNGQQLVIADIEGNG